MTLTAYRCLPDGGRSRPRPDRLTLEALDAVAPLTTSGPHVAVDVYGRPAGRPAWLAAGSEYLALLERAGCGVGVIYLIHFDQPIGDLHNPRGFASHYTGRATSSGLLKVLRQADGAEFAELAWVDRMGPPGAPGMSPALRHRLRVVGVCVPGAVVGTAVLLGTVGAGTVVVGTAAGAVVVGAGPDDDVVDVSGAWVAGGADRSAPATTTPTDVLPPSRDRLPNKLASGWLATVSTPVIATTAIPKASTAATATRCQRIGWGRASLAPSSLGPACSPSRRTSERRATLWADASEWVYRASAGATSRLISAAPMRVPSTPKKDATTAPLTAASAPASNLGTRSCSIPHLEVGVGDGGAAVWGPRARPLSGPSRRRARPTLATEAGSRQLPPGHDGDRAAWGSCSLGDPSFKADLVQRAELEAAHGPGGPELAHDPEHVGRARVHQSQWDCTLSDSRAEILLIDQESCSSVRACGARWLTRDNARTALSNALTNSRQIQHWTLDLPARLVDHAAGRGARLMQVVGELGIGWQLARIWTGTRSRERSLKRSGGAARRCPVCQLAAALGLQPPRSVDPIGLELGARVAGCAAAASPLELPPAVAV